MYTLYISLITNRCDDSPMMKYSSDAIMSGKSKEHGARTRSRMRPIIMSNNQLEVVASELEALRLENARLREQLASRKDNKQDYPLSLEEYQRYGRQMIVEETGGVVGQVKLKNTKVLVVGAGGLGSPALPYLAGSGVGQIGIVDNDVVETSNLHRQVLHDSSRVGMLKCESARQSITKLNPHVSIVTYPVRLNSTNAFAIFEGYDYVLDCTDSPLTRYLVSDVAVNLGITVVSASGLGTEGQLTILNFNGVGPCYRCFYPTPPPPNAVTSCQEGGVIGPCIGVVGTMMAVETLKLILGVYTNENFKPFLVLYSGFPQQSLRTFKMRGRKESCLCCGKNRTITKEAIEMGEINYELFCGSRNYNVCEPDERLSVDAFQDLYKGEDFSAKHIFLDVRPSHHYDISHFPETVNIPIKRLRDMNGDLKKLQEKLPTVGKDSSIVVLCRYGNDSQVATRLLKDEFGFVNVRDVRGGYFKYIDDIDRTIPKY
ncbi:Uba4p [Saccharomyces cerevisiae x Saccharomyces kudriavzevii VIN7]|uniref:Needs CLA4 to survive protein 3 n=1 Tax=Saccharomyces cerevisiae x Saccharomyces kudriavzevii (strain VIN7) TaxID=1095631 RepID=H0GVV3_SACCK|nr:Uba4p [Saccharomyces cerevisiae x Saccharomyces kudriavzevii VIN7]